MNLYSISQRKQRWRDFLSENGSTRYIFQINYHPDDKPRPWPWPDKKSERIEWAWEKYQRHLERIEWLNDDSIPFLDVYTGTEIFAEAFGCQVYRPEDNMPFALPMIHDASEVSKLKVPDIYTPPMDTLFYIADELHKRSGNDALIRLVDIQSPMDIAALIWDKNDLYIAMVDFPEAVKELSSKVKEFMFAFLDQWFSRYGPEFIAHYPTYYMPEGITLSEDEVGAIGEDMFLEFFLPELKDLSERYNGIGMHCCANARHQWNNFKLVPNLRLLNLVQSVDQIIDAYKFFSPIPQMHSWFGHGPAWTWPQQYPEEAKVVMETGASNRDEALQLADKLHEACHR